MTQTITQEQVLEALSRVKDPELHRSLTELNMVRKVEVRNNDVEITLAITVPNCPFVNQIEAEVREEVGALPGVSNVTLHIGAMTEEERKRLEGKQEEGTAAKYNQIQHVVAVMSGKGGVGKSLVTGLLATALAKEGHRIGILDADITGPSIPMLFGLQGPVEMGPVGIRPFQSKTGIKVISMNFLLPSEDQPVIWRGPLIGRAITQLWGDVMWGDLDYLFVDLPPGTSDAALTTMQSLPVQGIVIVTTPQSLATMIVRKAVHMAQTVGVPIIGVVENMSYFVCPDTGNRHFIFGPSHVNDVTSAASTTLLAQLPIDPEVAFLCDNGGIEDINLPAILKMSEAFSTVVTVLAKK